MIVGVISDTHNPSVGVLPPPEVAIAFQGVNVILHAGDIYVPSCLDWLEAIAPVYASRSTMYDIAKTIRLYYLNAVGSS